MSDINKSIQELIGSHGFAQVVAALVRYAHAPDNQEIPQPKMAKAFRDFNKLFEYLTRRKV